MTREEREERLRRLREERRRLRDEREDPASPQEASSVAGNFTIRSTGGSKLTVKNRMF